MVTVQIDVDWPTCHRDGCIGAQIPSGHVCLAHASDDKQDAALKRFLEAGNVDLRGVQVSGSLFDKIIGMAPADSDGDRTLPDVHFDKAAFLDEVSFKRTTFRGDA